MNTNVNTYEASCVLIYNQNTYKFLAVTRKDSDMIGLPAGKREHNETSKECAIRETFEETGISLNEDHLRKIHSNYVDNFFVTCYYVEYNGPCETNPKEEGVTPVWVYGNELIDNSPFSKYNEQIIENFLYLFT